MLNACLPLSREVAQRSCDGGRDFERILQRQYSINQKAEKKHDAMGMQTLVAALRAFVK